jgi:hypothetical protein
LRYLNRDGELDGLLHPRTYGEDVRIALSLLDGALNGERALYGSSELTTGRRLYAMLRQYAVHDLSALREKLGQAELDRLFWQPNLTAAAAFAHVLRDRSGGRELVVTPASFSAPGWGQSEYLAFWETLIRTRFKAVFFNDGWEYSNGCAFEFAVAQSEALPTFDAAGEPLARAAGIERLTTAARELAGGGFDTAGLRRALTWLGVSLPA